MRWQVGSLLALLAYTHTAQASGQYHYRRQDQPDGYNGTVVPQKLPSASPTNYNVTSVTVTYAFVPETHSPTTTSRPTTSVISSYLVISTHTKSLSIQANTGNFSSSTTSEAVSSAATGRPYPLSGAPSQSYVVPGNGTYPTAPKLSISQSGGSAASQRPKIVRPKPSNETCGGATLNVVNAHLDYWYTETYTHTVSTLSVQFNANDSQTGWTILPATTDFDISTAITERTCGPSTSLNTAYNRTSTRWDCFTTPTPVASSTTVLSIDAFTPTNQTTGNGTHLPNLATEPPLAVATLPSAAGTYTEGTPFVYFSEYEIESSQPTTLPDGSEACAVLTRSFMMNRLFSFAFEGDEDDLSQQSLASEDGTSGDIDESFLRVVGETDSVTIGTFSAQPTVIVVVERSVVAQAVLAATPNPMQAGGLITPTPTLPNFLTPIETTKPTAPTTNYSPRVEQTADALDVPTKTVNRFSRFIIFVAHIEHSATTLVLPTSTDTNVITTEVGGRTVTATALSNVIDNGGSGNAGNGGSNGNANGNPGSNNANGSGGDGNVYNGNGAEGAGGDGDSVFSASILSGTNVENGGDDEGDWIMMPFVAHLEDSAITLDVPAASTAEVVTAAVGGKILTATALHAVETGHGSQNGESNGHNTGGNDAGSNSGSAGNNDGQNGGGGVFGNFVSAIVNAAKPTNAAEVLSQAMAQEHHDATAAAIAAGIGGLAADVGASESGNSGSGGGNHNGQAGSDSGSSFGFGSSSGAVSGSNSGSGPGSNSGLTSGTDSDSGSSGSQFESQSESGSGVGSGSGSNGAIGSGSNVRLGASPGQVLTVDGAAITARPANAFVVDGQTAVPGGAPITVDGTVISVPASTNAIVVNGRTVPGEFASSTVFNINGMAITAQPGVGFPIAGETLQAGGPAITVDGTRLSLAPGGTALMVGSSTSVITAAAGGASEIPELTIGSQTFTANAATQFFLAPGQTLTPGGTAVVSGMTVSLEEGASAVVVNGETRIFGSPDGMITSSPSVIRVDGQAFAPNSGGTYLISGQTLTPGGSITITGSNGEQTLSLSPSGSELVAVVSGHTITNTISDSAAADATAAPVLTIGGQTFTALPGTDGANPAYLINGETLTAGEEATVAVGGKTYVVSLAPEATLLEVEELGASGKATTTRFQTLFPATATGRISTMTGGGSGSDSEGDGETGTGTGTTASPARKTGAASLCIDSSQLTSFFVAMGTLILVGML